MIGFNGFVAHGLFIGRFIGCALQVRSAVLNDDFARFWLVGELPFQLRLLGSPLHAAAFISWAH